MCGLKCENRCSRTYILKGFQIFYLVGCFVMDMWLWLVFRGGKEGIFLMFCCRQELVLVSSRWLWESCLCLLVAICTRIRCWMPSSCIWKKDYGCGFFVLWCPPLHRCLTELFVFTVALYMMFLYRHLFGRGHVLLTLQLHWLEGCGVLLVDAIFCCVFIIFCAILFVQL